MAEQFTRHRFGRVGLVKCQSDRAGANSKIKYLTNKFEEDWMIITLVRELASLAMDE